MLAQFKSEDGVLVGSPFDLPLDIPKDSLTTLCNAVLDDVRIFNFNNHFYRDEAIICLLCYFTMLYIIL